VTVKVRKLRNLSEANRANELYRRGDEAWSKGRLRPAFRFFLAAARAGMVPAFRVIGQFYDRGEGTARNKGAALFWYRRAAQSGDYSAANNVGCIWRDRGKVARALRWFERAVQLGDPDASLNIARVYLRRGDSVKARPYLRKVSRSPWATEQSKEEARRLLKKKMTTRKADIPSLRRPQKSGSARVAAG
jgi:TPR repeat protein